MRMDGRRRADVAEADAGLGLPTLRPWHFILAFGLVSLLTDMVYEGARSIIGPYLATMDASATLVGVVAGAGEFIGYGLRVVSGYVVQRSQCYWTWTILGYALTVVSIPLIGATGALTPAVLLYGAERLGKAVRSPAKDTLISHAASRTGLGSAFGVHQALDQAGAVLGPLLLAAVLSWRDGDYGFAFGVLAGPGALVLALLLWLRHRAPDPLRYEHPARAAAAPGDDAARAPVTAGRDRVGLVRGRLPRRFWLYAGTIAVLSSGVATFPLLAFHAQTTGLLTDPQVPALFAVAMCVDGLCGLIAGRVYDRRGAGLLLVVPVAAAASALAFASQAILVWVGVAIWGVVNGILDSTVKAVVTELVPSRTRAVAFGWLALMRGTGLVAGALLGAAYDVSIAHAVTAVLVVNLAGLIGVSTLLRRMRA